MRRGLWAALPSALLVTVLLLSWAPLAGATHGGCHDPAGSLPDPEAPHSVTPPPAVQGEPFDDAVPDPDEADDAVEQASDAFPSSGGGTERMACTDQNDPIVDPDRLATEAPEEPGGPEPEEANATEEAGPSRVEPAAPADEFPGAPPAPRDAPWVEEAAAAAPPPAEPACDCPLPAPAAPPPPAAALPAAMAAEDPALARAAPAAATAAVGGLLLWRLAALLLAGRRTPSDALHPRAQALLDAVCGQPGLSLRGLRAATGLANGVALHHLATLLRQGLVVAHRHRNTVRFFENHGRYAASWRQAAALRDRANQRLLAWVAANPGARQRDVVAGGAAWGWRRGVTQKRLGLLAEAGLLVAQRAGREVRYEARAPAESLPDGMRVGAPMGAEAGATPAGPDRAIP